MEDLIILGLDIHALEVIDMIDRAGVYRFAGLVCESPPHPPNFYGHPVLGSTSGLVNLRGVKKVPMHTWKDRDDKTDWVSVVAPSAFIASSAVVGRGTIIYPNCFVGASARLGDGVFMLSGSVINHDCAIDDDVIITSGVTLAGGVKIKSGAYLGQACAVRQNLTVGEKSFIGMGAVVTKDVPDRTTVTGCPARPYYK